VSARFNQATFGLTLIAALAAPVAAFEAPAPQTPTTAQPGAKPAVDEAAKATQESDEALRHGDGVAAIVNDTPISNYDVRQRMQLFIATAGIKPSPEAQKEIRAQVLKQLETERLELLEAQKSKITVSASEVDKEISNIMEENHLTREQLNKLLAGADVRIETLRAELAAQMAWSKLVQDALGDRVHVSQLDVSDELARLKAGANKPHYVVSEIFQAVDTPEQDAKVKKDMEDLKAQLNAGAPFQAVARQLSQNPTAAQGGDLGAVQEGQLPPELDKALKTMHSGETSEPIRATGGYYIIKLREVQLPEGAPVPEQAPQRTGPAGTVPLVRILLPLPQSQKPNRDLIERAGQAAAVMRAQIQSCEGAKQIAAKLPGTSFISLGDMRLADLAEDMQQAINEAGPGGVTQPLVSTAGVPSRDQVEQQIYEEQITTLARQYLRDLRRDADVETVQK
jgi:peptidyl-prolyl cis-trans isomerase SurA